MAHSKKRQKESQTAHKEKRRPLKQPFRQLRNSEKRKEKSRDAARCRRGKESEIFSELASALPLPPQTVAQLDKASVMRLTLAFLKTRALCQAGLSKVVCKNDSKGNSSKLDIEMDALLLKALDGFLLVLSTDGDIVYTSENIIAFLGLPQVDVMGQSLYEYTHPCDHEEVRELMSAKELQEPRYAFLRLKCTLTAKGRSVNLKSASYKVVQVSGEMVGGEKEAWLVALGSPVPHPSNIEFPLDKQTFVSKHSLDMKFTYVDDDLMFILVNCESRSSSLHLGPVYLGPLHLGPMCLDPCI
nr:hypoxia-inducible factor 1-alpha-like [Cherax quadricarinatus]